MHLRFVVLGAVASSLAACAAAWEESASQRLASVGGPTPLTVRAEGGALWTAATTETAPRRTWSTPGRSTVEHLAIDEGPGGGHLVSFCQSGNAWLGELDAERRTLGPLAWVGFCAAQGVDLAVLHGARRGAVASADVP